MKEFFDKTVLSPSAGGEVNASAPAVTAPVPASSAKPGSTKPVSKNPPQKEEEKKEKPVGFFFSSCYKKFFHFFKKIVSATFCIKQKFRNFYIEHHTFGFVPVRYFFSMSHKRKSSGI